MPPRTKKAKTDKASTSRPSSSRAPAPVVLDTTRFVNERAMQKYGKLKDKDIIRERGIRITSAKFAYIEHGLRMRNWTELKKRPPSACKPLVREFYANMEWHTSGEVFVRGRSIPAGYKTINQYYKTPEVENDDYHSLLHNWNNDIAEEVKNAITIPGSTWHYYRENPSIPQNLWNRQLNAQARVWLRIVVSRLLPVGHTTALFKEWCTLLYCLVTNKTINLGRMIFQHMFDTTDGTHLLGHPSLITALCQQHNVLPNPDDEMVQPMAVYDDRAAENELKRRQRLDASETAAPAHGAEPDVMFPVNMVQRLDRVEAELQGIRQELQDNWSHITRCSNKATRQYNHLHECLLQLERLHRLQLDPSLDLPDLPRSTSELGEEEPEDEEDAEEVAEPQSPHDASHDD